MTLRPVARHGSPFAFMYGLAPSDGSQELKLRDVLDAIEGTDSMQEAFSLMDTKMHELYPDLFKFSKSVSIGSAGTGVAFHHSHGHAYLGVVHGKKRWFFYPPSGPARALKRPQRSPQQINFVRHFCMGSQGA